MTIEKEVFGFEITVDNVSRMEVFNGKDDRREIEPGDIGGEPSCPSKMRKKFATWNIRQEHIDIDLVLVGGMQFDDKWMSYTLKNNPLRVDVFHLLQPHNF